MYNSRTYDTPRELIPNIGIAKAPQSVQASWNFSNDKGWTVKALTDVDPWTEAATIVSTFILENHYKLLDLGKMRRFAADVPCIFIPGIEMFADETATGFLTHGALLSRLNYLAELFDVFTNVVIH